VGFFPVFLGVIQRLVGFFDDLGWQVLAVEHGVSDAEGDLTDLREAVLRHIAAQSFPLDFGLFGTTSCSTTMNSSPP